MSFTKKTTFLFIFFINFICINTIISQNLYGGIEIGGKGIKITVMDIHNAKKNLFDIKEFWTENTALARGIAIDGNLHLDDLENTYQVIQQNFNKLQDTHHVSKEKIYIIISSGVGMAKNVSVLVDKIKELTQKNAEVINSELEARLLVKGGIPANRYLNSLILDIGGGNTKGGYIGLYNEENFVLMPLSMNYATVTFTEKIKKHSSSDSFEDFLKTSYQFQDTLKKEINKMYDMREGTRTKKNVYLSGGAVWAFATLTATAPIENFHKITLEEVSKHQLDLIGNFTKFETLSKTNPEIEKVLNTYSQRHLITANNILLSAIQNLDEPKDKKIYFVKQGQIAWLMAYILESAKDSKTIY
ncbi:hypothetical protein B0A58_05960 [Flavobacterium branchiophilum NBRC 15030 = ATCC 35035]|uniref:Ppx/GppA phosphatase family protein n=1 Tax=Flavobacterium branchiophilum TaxID=55197 RepID=A0A543G0M0_9FLAO|nr:exopolyphosphatase [Flavobacterium branchiophilum]OXA77208.1 hypothetical protein B0A58_05960 [Flavobacterium branchiophilum NBRC 15030 = ATCC 35035]TQM39613.1 Ppx/GppA phosphatase family protein [Flavobacterium branchiophilum]GEM55733.1 exopolyphosphatase [Flavobacterium branchiophilum NBRC 15030 = ATCC 35035]